VTERVIVWDLETVVDPSAMARIQSRPTMTAIQIREALAGQFPKLPVHQIVCIGALIASAGTAGWTVESLGAPHSGDRSEAELISAFIQRIGDLNPQLISFNGFSFDLPVLRYRAMLHRICAPGLFTRAYFNRFTEDSIDLCDTLASYSAQARVSLDLLSKALGLSGKPAHVSGADVERLVAAGRLQDVADYCEIDVLNTYRLWLLFELFRSRLNSESWRASETNLLEFISQRWNSKPHLKAVMTPLIA
jgi:predicted PolB exonuclease-like 3'-5' exonuclease